MTEQNRPLDVLILAAGQGTRMKSALPKVLHPVAGRPMAAWAVKVARELGARKIVVVTGHGAEQVEAALQHPEVAFARQKEQRGTADAFLSGVTGLTEQGADILVLSGDSPLLRAETLRQMVEDHRAQGSAMTVLTGVLPDAGSYGRIVRGADGQVERIVEKKDATPEELAITEFNSGVYLLDERSPELAAKIGNQNKAGEYYLTDILGLYHGMGAPVRAFTLGDPDEVEGANDREALAKLEGIMQERINKGHQAAGVTLTLPQTIFIEDTVQIGRDVTIEPGVILRGQTQIAEGATIGAYSVITDSVIGEGAVIKAHSVLEESQVGAGSDVGPFARLRPGSVLGEHVHIGNFVETKNARLDAGVKAGHLAYLGDVEIGAETNVGAGTIVANFDGLNKHPTKVGAGVFIGSNTTLIAPRTVGDAAFIAGGSAIHEDIPEGAMAVARGKQRNIEGWAQRYWSAPDKQEKLAKKLPWLAQWLKRRG